MSDAPAIVPAENVLTVFTDGSSIARPRSGGIGIRFVHVDTLGAEMTFDLDEPGFAGATNNQMELKAVIVALKALRTGRVPAYLSDGTRRIDLYTDSLYVVDNLHSAVYDWPTNGWATRTGAPVLNVELWKELVHEYKKLRRTTRVEIKWGKGHSAGNPHNKAADKLAKRSAARPVGRLGTVVSVRRKKTRRRTEPGSVEMLGQRLTIRIIDAQYLAEQRVTRYRYEVMSRASPFHGNVDFAYSEDPMMRPGHTYFVTMGEDAGYPRIVKRHREVQAKS